MPIKPFGWLPRSKMDDLQVDLSDRFFWFARWCYKTFCLSCEILLGVKQCWRDARLSCSLSSQGTCSPLVLLLCSCTALEQLQPQVSINFLLTQPNANKKIIATLLGQSNCPSGLVSYKERGLKKLIERVAYKVSGSGWTHSVKFHRFQAIYLRVKYISAVYYIPQQVQDYSATKLSDRY